MYLYIYTFFTLGNSNDFRDDVYAAAAQDLLPREAPPGQVTADKLVKTKDLPQDRWGLSTWIGDVWTHYVWNCLDMLSTALHSSIWNHLGYLRIILRYLESVTIKWKPNTPSIEWSPSVFFCGMVPAQIQKVKPNLRHCKPSFLFYRGSFS